MREWSVSPEYLKKWAGPSLSYPLDDRQLERYLDGANHPAESGLLVYCAVLRATGQTVGHISLSGIDRENGSARISRVVVDPGSQGRGIGLQMVREVLRIGFEGLRLHRISLEFSISTRRHRKPTRQPDLHGRGFRVRLLHSAGAMPIASRWAYWTGSGGQTAPPANE